MITRSLKATSLKINNLSLKIHGILQDKYLFLEKKNVVIPTTEISNNIQDKTGKMSIFNSKNYINT
jgi:hypothetical protein